MAVLLAKGDNASHWYTTDGRPMHRILDADGRTLRDTLLADAITHRLLPSVTAIAKQIHKPALERWKLHQAVLASKSLVRFPSESDDSFCTRALYVAFQQVESACALGSAVHKALDQALVGIPVPADLRSFACPILNWQQSRGIRPVEHEVVLVNPDEGFAGQCDLTFTWGDPAAGNMGLLDYKSRKTEPGKPVIAYEDQGMQLAAYAATRWGVAALPRVRAANVFFSTTEPGRMEVVPHEPQDLVAYWTAFKALCAVWRVFYKYDPRTAFRAAA